MALRVGRVIVGIAREGRRLEGRAPVSPTGVKELVRDHGLTFLREASPVCAFSSQEYRDAGAEVVHALEGRAQVVFGVKELPCDMIRPDTTYLCFSHTIKGQPAGMDLLKTVLDRNAVLIDYERIVDGQNRRLVAFGNFAGKAGVPDTLNLLGLRMSALGITPNPFSHIKQAIHYRGGLDEVKEQLREVGENIRRDGLPASIAPFVVGFIGYGRVITGALEVFDALKPVELTPEQLLADYGSLDNRKVYKVIFREKDTVRPADPSAAFSLEDYAKNPGSYVSSMAQYLPRLTAVINGIYWQRPQPRLVTKEDLMRQLEPGCESKLIAIGDISCDINGSFESTVMGTSVEDPFFVYDPRNPNYTHSVGYQGEGIAVNAIENAPCGLPREASEYFSSCLVPFVPGIVNANYGAKYSIGVYSLPEEVQPAVVAWRGELNPLLAANRDVVTSLRNNGKTPHYHFW